MKKLSVIIATYNRRDFLERCLYCVCETTSEATTKIYVIDNASTDDTPDFLASLKKWKPRFHIFRSKINLGTEARHKILPLVDTPYVFALDDDCWISTKQWDIGMLDCFDNDSNLGGLMMCTVNDERNQLGVTWDGVSYNEFLKPRFRCEDSVEKFFGVKNGVDDKHRACSNNIVGHWVLKNNGGIDFAFSGCSTMFRTDIVKKHQWQAHAGLMSDVAGEWGKITESEKLYLGLIQEYCCYHATGAWWHIGRYDNCWKNKSQQSPVIYNRSEKQQWSFLEQAKEWSGWGSGIQDADELLKSIW